MLHRHVFLRLSDGGDTVNGIPSLWISYTCFPYVFFFSSYWRWIFCENFPRQIWLLRILLFEIFIHVMLVLLLLVSEVFWSTALMLSACLIQDNKTLFGYVKRKKCFFFCSFGLRFICSCVCDEQKGKLLTVCSYFLCLFFLHLLFFC